ncbi:MAG: metallophosphoesterase [Bryobacteraceae bacterium]|nr:metallophosphoesterase [Bryobacteraceae bacterium]MDW8379306.1 metallophosphoesterase [Bryobacterales bacterium]
MSRLVEIARGIWAHASGALWLELIRTLVIADAHLGYGWAMRRRGQLGPLRDEETIAKLRGTVEELTPSATVFLGDLVHAPRPTPEEGELLQAVFEWLASRTRLILVEGNHDRGFRRDFGHVGFEICREWKRGEVCAIHGDRAELNLPAHHLIVGHFHPTLGLRDAAGALHRLPVFLHDSKATVLPAFSPFAAGCDVREGVPEQMLSLFSSSEVAVFAVTGRQVKALGSTRLRCSGRASAAARSSDNKEEGPQKRRLA